VTWYRVICTGSRDWEGAWATERIGEVLQSVWAMTTTLGVQLVLRHGDCPTGADAIVDRWGRRRSGVAVETYQANWTLGRSAGPRRNQDMVNDGAEMCIGFHRNNSLGTWDCLQRAIADNIPTFVIPWRAEVVDLSTYRRKKVKDALGTGPDGPPDVA
jgi:hypothetical protein